MRITSGNYGGRRLGSLARANTRPTTDKVRESIFDMVEPYFNGETVLNLFIGSGDLAIEIVSRGYSHTVCIDKNYQAPKIIKKDIEVTKEPEKFTTIRLNANKAIERLAAEKQRLDYLLLDPSCAKQKIIDQIHKIEELGLFSETTVIVCETDKTVELPEIVAELHQIRKQIYGMAAVATCRKEGNQ